MLPNAALRFRILSQAHTVQAYCAQQGDNLSSLIFYVHSVSINVHHSVLYSIVSILFSMFLLNCVLILFYVLSSIIFYIHLYVLCLFYVVSARSSSTS